MPRWPTPFALSDEMETEEMVSGVRAVNISQSGRLRIAMASVSGRMPAIGVMGDNVLSGKIASFQQVGLLEASSGLLNLSSGRVLFVGRSGHIAALSGSWSSGGFGSGDLWQRIGVAVNSGGFRCFIDVSPFELTSMKVGLDVRVGPNLANI